MKSILVLCGGKSTEHDISIITGLLVYNCLQGYNKTIVYIDKDGCWYVGEKLKNIDFYKHFDYKKVTQVTLLCGKNGLYNLRGKRLFTFDCVLNCLHGGIGENGVLSGLFEDYGIAITSPNTTTQSAFMDKCFTKILLKGLNINCVKSLTFDSEEFYLDRDKIVSQVFKFNKKVVIKPCDNGSSIGITFAQSIDEIKSGLELAFNYSNKVLVEEYIEDFIEVNCGAYKHNDTIVVSKTEIVKGKNKILTFEDKYTGVKGESVKTNSKLPKTIDKKIKQITRQVYQTLRLNGVIRIDYIVKDNEVYLNEVNTVPGSLSYYLFCDSLSGCSDYLKELIENSISQNNQRQFITKTFESSVLDKKYGVKK